MTSSSITVSHPASQTTSQKSCQFIWLILHPNILIPYSTTWLAQDLNRQTPELVFVLTFLLFLSFCSLHVYKMRSQLLISPRSQALRGPWRRTLRNAPGHRGTVWQGAGRASFRRLSLNPLRKPGRDCGRPHFQHEAAAPSLASALVLTCSPLQRPGLQRCAHKPHFSPNATLLWHNVNETITTTHKMQLLAFIIR